jgi:uncharacterized protein with GYD domain
MPKYLMAVSYTAEGAKGVAKEGGTGRLDAARDMIESLGGKLECFYFAFGEADVYAIADVPGSVEAAALALAVGASGAVATKTSVLLTPQEVDEAAKKAVRYRPPGA